MTDVPDDILRAAEKVESYFTDRGVMAWKLGNIQSQHQPMVPQGVRLVEATTEQLHTALSASSHPPEDGLSWVHQVGLQLALMCIGRKTVRLKLLNGRTVRVSMEV